MREALRQGLLNVSLKLGEGVDRGGKPYAWMVDTRELLLQGSYLHLACKLLWERLQRYELDFVAGMTLAANPLVVGMLYESGHSVSGAIIRRSPKENGLRKLVEGPEIPPGARVAILDDLVNAGDTQRQAIAAVRPFGCDIVAAGVIIDYEKEGAAWLREQGIPLESLFTLAELGVAWREPTGPAVRPLWTFEGLNSGRYNAPKSIPAVRPEALYVGSDQGFLLALGLDGQELWRFPVRDRERGIHSSPWVEDGRAYFGAYDGYLYCVEEGRLVWETRPGQWIGSSPALHEGRLYVGIEYGQSGGGLLAVEAATGKRLWEAPAGDYMHASPCLDPARGQVIVGANDHILRAVDLASGKVRWEHEAGGPFKAWAAVDEEGSCFAASFDGFLYALDAATGSLRWKRRLSSNLYCTPVLYRDLVLAGGHSGRLVAMERATGQVRWVTATNGALVGGPALRGEQVVCAALDGTVTLLNAADGSPLGSFKTQGKIMGAPGVGEGMFFVSDFSGRLYAFL